MSASRPEVSPGFLLWRATLRWQREIVAALKPYDLTHVQFVLLVSTWWLGENGDPPSQAQVAAHAAADVMMTSSVLRTLERRGLVTRSPDPADARVKRLTVTEAGRRLALETVAVVEAADAAFFARAGDRQHVLEVLSPLAAPEEDSR